MNDTLPLGAIRIGERHRVDLGDLDALAASIREVGLLHPPVVDAEGTLICGYRRVEAAKRLGWEAIPVRVVDLGDRLQAERDENESRKDFTVSERVAIARALRDRVGERRGRRTDRDGNVQDLVHFRLGQKTGDALAREVGLKNRETFRRAERVIDDGVPGLAAALDRGAVSVDAAALVAGLPRDEQERVVAGGPEAIRARAAEVRRGRSRVNGVLADDPPDVAERRESGRIAPGVVVEVTEPAREPGEDDDREAEAVPELDDEAWLATLPARSALGEDLRRRFDDDALIYRRLSPARRAFHERATRLARGRGAYAWRVRQFLRTPDPRHWVACAPAEQGGCGGLGEVPAIGACPACHGRGYRIGS